MVSASLHEVGGLLHSPAFMRQASLDSRHDSIREGRVDVQLPLSEALILLWCLEEAGCPSVTISQAALVFAVKLAVFVRISVQLSC